MIAYRTLIKTANGEIVTSRWFSSRSAAVEFAKIAQDGQIAEIYKNEVPKGKQEFLAWLNALEL